MQYLKEVDIPESKKLYISADSIEMSNLSLFELAKEFAAKGGKNLAICFSEPYELNLSKLAQKIEINRHTLYRYIEYLNSGNILTSLKPNIKGDAIFTKPEKIYLNNTNLNYCYCEEQKIGTIRETFVVSQLKNLHDLNYSKKGDIVMDNKYLIEIGGKNKDFSQIGNSGYLFVDDVEIGYGRKIPLWLIGFLY